ncbi:MAG TPA: carboxymuconolactone decarboxylase family protein [Solirubrobacteraceae bacterium]|nr:carboxymuconolactone decarboxylase family protein [Solirubrobacteraceae bacterium]
MSRSDGDPGARGRAIERRIFGEKADAIDALMSELDPDVGRWAREFVFGDVWAHDALDFSERLLVAIVSLAALGKTEQLRNYLFGALTGGVPEAKVQQALAMICVYAGFPAAMNALVCWREVKASDARRRGRERERRGALEAETDAPAGA